MANKNDMEELLILEFLIQHYYSTRACWISIDYNQQGAFQCTIIEQLLLIALIQEVGRMSLNLQPFVLCFPLTFYSGEENAAASHMSD